ncbi:MAG: protein kinase [Myxococcales bacterium]
MDESRSASASVQQNSEVDPLLGRFINDRYKVVSVIARGGMGKVYRAEQAPLGRQVALKVLSPNYNGENDPEFHRRFFLEASIASKLSHPNTVTIFDYGKTEDEVFYIAMELLEGRTLQRALRDEGPMEPDRVMRIARQICRSLREAHSLDVIHRDLKPANVYLVRQEEGEYVKVLDFGLVKELNNQENLTKTGLFMGSPKYMAPEQIRSDHVDGRTDIYALGVIMYEMLSGKVPFDRANSVNILMAHIHEQVPSIGEMSPGRRIPPQLESVVHRCMAKRPQDRYASMNEVLQALKLAGGERSGQITITGPHTAQPAHGRGPQQTLVDESFDVDADFAGSDSGAGLEPVARRSMQTSTTISAAPVFARASKPGNSAAPIFLAALFAVTGIGGFIVLTQPFDTAEEDKPLVIGTTAPAKKPDPVPAEAPAPEPSKRLVVTLKSVPPGAMVTVGDKEYGPTPAHVVWTGADAADGREVTFRFHRRGYQDLTVTQTIEGDRLQVDAPPLEPLVRKAKSSAEPPKPDGA